MNIIEEKGLDVSLLSNEELIKEIHGIEEFLKFVNDEIKKTDIGDENE